MSKDVSIILCCYNSENVIIPTLTHLANLDISSIDVELIFVDNASTDNTIDLAKELWQAFGTPYPIKFLFEPKPGLMFARETGLQVVKHDYIVFVDDDNWIARDFVQVVYRYFNNHSVVGAIGSNNSPVFGGDKPFWFDRFENWYAVGTLINEQGVLREIGLFGAGLSIRKSAFDKLKQNGFKNYLTGRLLGSLTSGEDYELCKAIYLAGWEIVWLPQLQLKHFIKSERLNWSYFRKLNIGESKSILFLLAYEFWINGKNNFFAPITYSWSYLLIKTSIKAFALGLTFTISLVLKKEGSSSLISYERSKVLLSSLIHYRKRYSKLRASIKKAKWRDY